MGGRTVIKFGGSDLSTGKRIRKAAEMVVKSNYEGVIVVVSAMGKTTDRLIKNLSQIGNVSGRDYAEIISMGERTSARVFCSALKSLGVKATYIDPTQKNWPIITDSNFRNAKPDLEKTRVLAKKYLEPILEDTIPVVCGFLGRDGYGNITTLGRGGSDITALLLANCLEANEAVLVKDTKGVLSADPKFVPDAKLLDKLDIHEMFALAYGGAEIIRSEALKYKLPKRKLRVASFFSDNIAEGGTEIVGVFNTNSAEISKREHLLAINLVGVVSAESLNKLFSILHNKPIYGVSTGKNVVTVFTSLKNVNETINRLHALNRFKAISCRNKVGMVAVTNPIFIDSPGWIAKISERLSSKNINIIEIITSTATINVFIDEGKLKEAIETISDMFKK